MCRMLLLQCGAVCHGVLQRVIGFRHKCDVLCTVVAVCCTVLQCIVVCCSVLQCVIDFRKWM